MLAAMVGHSNKILAEDAPVAKTESPQVVAKSPGAEVPVITSVDVKAGDQWNYQVYDEITAQVKLYSNYTVTEVQDGQITTSVTALPPGQTSGNSYYQLFDATWNLIEDTTWVRKPSDPNGGIKLPLKVGATWKSRFVSTRKNPDLSVTSSAMSKVVAYEPVILKSGATYDAFKIEVEETTNLVGGQATNLVKTTYWYSPQVNRFVKRVSEGRTNNRLQFHTVEQLVRYTRRHDD